MIDVLDVLKTQNEKIKLLKTNFKLKADENKSLHSLLFKRKNNEFDNIVPTHACSKVDSSSQTNFKSTQDNDTQTILSESRAMNTQTDPPKSKNIKTQTNQIMGRNIETQTYFQTTLESYVTKTANDQIEKLLQELLTPAEQRDQHSDPPITDDRVNEKEREEID